MLFRSINSHNVIPATVTSLFGNDSNASSNLAASQELPGEFTNNKLLSVKTKDFVKNNMLGVGNFSCHDVKQRSISGSSASIYSASDFLQVLFFS